MVSFTKLLAAGFAASVAVCGVTATAPAHATPVPAVALTNATQSAAAADYLVSQLEGGNHLTSSYTGQADVGMTADGLLGILASQTHATEAKAMDAWLKTQAATYAAKGAGAAGKLAIVAVAMGDDPTNYGGVNLVQAISTSLAKDPTAGGSSFSAGLAVIGLLRAGQTVPAPVIAALVAAQDASGAFGYLSGTTFTADVDTTGIALLALSQLSDPAAKAAAAKATTWLQSQLSGAYWPTYSPANSAGVAIPALRAMGVTTTAQTTWLLGQQVRGSGFPASLGGTTADAYATAQALMGISGASLVTVQLVLPAATSPATATASAAPTTAPVATTSTPAATTAPTQPTLPNTGDGAGLPIALAGGAVLVAVVVSRRRS